MTKVWLWLYTPLYVTESTKMSPFDAHSAITDHRRLNHLDLELAFKLAKILFRACIRPWPLVGKYPWVLLQNLHILNLVSKHLHTTAFNVYMCYVPQEKTRPY